MKICDTNPKCEKDPSNCGYSINCSSFDEYEKGEPTHFIGGIDCPYCKSENANCNLVSCRYNAGGECENGEKRKECVEVSKLVLCEPNKNENVQAKHDENGELLLFVDGKLINDKIMRVTKAEKEDKQVFTVEVKY